MMMRPGADRATREQLAALADHLEQGRCTPAQGDDLRRRIRAGERIFDVPVKLFIAKYPAREDTMTS